MNGHKHFLFFLFLFLSLFHISKAQVEFRRVYGGADYDQGYSVTQTYDKGYVVTGSTTSFGNGNSDAYILKTDSMGVALWYKTFGGINIDKAYSIKETSDSGLVIAGFTNSSGNGGYDMYVVKTDKLGSPEWTKNYGGTNWDFAYDIEQTTDGGYIITGGTYSFGKGDEDMYLVKTNSIGDTLWTKTFGGIYEDEAKSVKQSSDGGYIITGHTKSFGDLLGDIYVVKTDSAGDSLWTYKYNGGNEDYSNEVIEDINSGYILGGNTKLVTGNNFNGIVISLSVTGIINSIDTSFGGTANNDFIASIKQSAGGRFAAAGSTFSYGYGFGTSDFMLHIHNPFNGFHGPTMGDSKNETAYCLNNTKDGGYIICGITGSYSILDHIFLVKTDSNGISPLAVNSFLLGLNEAVKKNNLIKLYPVPTSGNLFIEILTPQENSTSISINDILGREFFHNHYNTQNSNYNINTSEIPNGIYFVNIHNNAFNSTERIIIQH